MSFSQTELDSVPRDDLVAVVLDTRDSRLVAEAEKVMRDHLTSPRGAKYILHFCDRGIDLRPAGRPNATGYRINFEKIDRRTGAGNLSRSQPLPKAVGGNTKTILDATAGFGQDAAMLALMGYSVTAIERSPIISAMLRDGLWRAEQYPALKEALGGRLVFKEEDSLETLNTYTDVDVVYLDPMFPSKRKKSALPPGRVQALQSIVGVDDQKETELLFQQAMETATQRVVIKRPLHAPVFGDNPVAMHEGKLVRYEVYLPHSLPRG